jgi:peptide/nickel transport system substrate-binding protein
MGFKELAFFIMMAGLSGFAGQASAEELKIAVGSEPTSMDPVYHNLTPNFAVARHIFDQLVEQDEKQRLIPGLATEWHAVDDTTWEFKLRPGVRFHDGTPVTAADIEFSIARPATVANSPSSYTIYTKSVKSVEAIDPITIRIRTNGPYPLLPADLSNISISPKKTAEGKSTEDFNSGLATIGTGPYKFVEWVPGNRIVLMRNEEYWGEKPIWDKVTIRPITSGASRIAALLAGDIDMIEDVPTADIAALKKNPKVGLTSSVSNRVIFLHIDTNRDHTPFVFDKAGKPLDRNP